ncbi:helix-turn-helix domain-containing protein [Streptomyces marincola]|uniref:Transcriptional regulator n=1 Tax=Streptomyces marincola TaxID=2878388 RepID=A0A1W7CX91_9ACTN|nr:helix-turn-helix domain-containing protein [Streptomyces marincola]ARQ69451.1 transcriptional regulator [Streptomyces marincola]
MGVWLVGSDVLARGRFAVSALSETVAVLLGLAGIGVAPGEAERLAAHRPAFRALLAREPFAAAFVAHAVRPRWLPDFLTVPPLPGDSSFHDELDRLRATPRPRVAADLAECRVRNGDPGPPPPALDVPDPAGATAALLGWVWTRVVAADWPRRRRLFEADIVSRTHAVGTGGWAATVAGLRPGLRWLGEGRLRINARPYPPRDLAAAQLLFIPATTPRGWVGWDEPHRYAITYPCAGLLGAEGPAPAPAEALRRLIGPARAAVLAALAAPRSTTQLAALTGLALGSVGDHLKVLREAGLVDRRRAGRSVLYYRTELGERLTER